MKTARKSVSRPTAFDFDAPPPVAQQPARRQAAPRRPKEVVRREKREKFKDIMGPRAAKAIHDIRLLSYGASKKRYYYTEKDIELLRQRLLDEVESALSAYYVQKEGSEKIEFD